MSAPAAGVGAVIMRYLARAIGGPRFIARQVYTATLSVAEALFGLWNSGLLPDVRRMKEAMLRKTEAEAARVEAEAQKELAESQKRLAEAAEAANRASLAKRNDAIARAEKQQRQAEAAKTQAEADAIRMDAETRRLQAIIEGQAKLLDALCRLRQEGGEMAIDPEQLQKLLNPPFPRQL